MFSHACLSSLANGTTLTSSYNDLGSCLKDKKWNKVRFLFIHKYV